MLWQDIREEFFETLEEEFISDLLEKNAPWEVLRHLKEFLYSSISKLPRLVPQEVPFSKNLFITTQGEIIPYDEILNENGRYYYKGEEIKGALVMAGAFIKGRQIYLGANVKVEPFSYLEEPAYFSENTQIRQGAYIRGAVYTGKGAIVGHTTEVKNSIFLREAKAAHFAYVGDSILGAHVNLGAGTKLANLKFHRKEIILEIKGVKIKTGLNKMGALLGDRVQTGCNAVLSPGILLGKDSLIYPGVCVASGYYPPKTKIKSK
ncbi:MAG: hypothetical protein P3W84_000465 [Thermodesulfobacteriaceae bacterium]|nr:hypothetical protein [Thermodesulfobacteriaceae bacterium]